MKKWITAAFTIVLFASCEKEEKACNNPAERIFDLTGFTKVEAGGHFQVHVTRGTQFSITARGCQSELDELSLDVRNMGTLYIDFTVARSNRSAIEVDVVLPQLNSVTLTGAAKATVDGFAGQTSLIRHVLSGLSACTVEGTGINAQVELSGTSHLRISGETESLYGSLSGEASLLGYETNAREVDISTSGKAKAWVNPIEVIYAEASGESRVYYRGNPPGVHTNTTGSGKVIHE